MVVSQYALCYRVVAH